MHAQEITRPAEQLSACLLSLRGPLESRLAALGASRLVVTVAPAHADRYACWSVRMHCVPE